MDDTQQSRVSDAAATRKRRSSILKSQRPARTPFSELEFNVATPTDTAKSRRVSFSRRTGVAEFVTNEATTTWKNFYEEHNKSLESSGNDSDANATRQPIEHLGKRIFDDQFEEVEGVDFMSGLNPSLGTSTSLNNINFTDQIASLDCTSDLKLAAPRNAFELSALTDHQSKLFGNDFTVTGVGELSGRIEVNFSTIQHIEEKDDLDAIERDLIRGPNTVSVGPSNRHDISEYIEVDLNMTHVSKNDDCDMSITDTVHSPKVQDVSKNCSIDKKLSVSKDWVTDKENIAINPYAAPREADNFAVNDEPNQVLVFDGKRLTIQTEKPEKEFRKTLVPPTETPQRKTIVLNTNDDLPNFVSDVSSKSEIESKHSNIYNDFDVSMMSHVRKVEIVPKRTTIHDNTGNISITQALPSKIISGVADKRRTTVYDEEGANVSITQALPSKIISGPPERRRTMVYNEEEGNISMTQALPSNIISVTAERQSTVQDIDQEFNISMTQALPAKIISGAAEKRRTMVYDQENANISMTQALPTNIISDVVERRRTTHDDDDDVNISMTQALPSNIISGATERRRTVVYDQEEGNISMTQVLPSNIISGAAEKRKTIHYDDEPEANISITQVLPANIINDAEEKHRTMVYDQEDANISMTQVLPSNIISAAAGKRLTMVYTDDDADANVSMTQVLPSNIINGATVKRQTMVFDDEDANISVTQTLPAKVISSAADKHESKIFDQEANKNLSMAQVSSVQIIIENTKPTERRRTVLYENDSGNISITQMLPASILQTEDQDQKEKRKTVVFDANNGNISVVKSVPIDTTLESISPKKDKTIIFDKNELNISINQKVLPVYVVLDTEREDKNRSIMYGETSSNLSMTQAVPTNLNISQKPEAAEKRRTVVFHDDTGNISVTQALLANIVLGPVDSEEKALDVSTANISLKDIDTHKRRTIVFEDDTGNISVTRTIPAQVLPSGDSISNVITTSDIDEISVKPSAENAIKRKTITFDENTCDISSPQAVYANIITPTKDMSKDNSKNDTIHGTNSPKKRPGIEFLLSGVESHSNVKLEDFIEPAKDQTMDIDDDEIEREAEMSTKETSPKVEVVQEAVQHNGVVHEKEAISTSATRPIPTNIVTLQTTVMNNLVIKPIFAPSQDVLVYPSVTSNVEAKDNTIQNDIFSQESDKDNASVTSPSENYNTDIVEHLSTRTCSEEPSLHSKESEAPSLESKSDMYNINENAVSVSMDVDNQIDIKSISLDSTGKIDLKMSIMADLLNMSEAKDEITRDVSINVAESSSQNEPKTTQPSNDSLFYIIREEDALIQTDMSNSDGQIVNEKESYVPAVEDAKPPAIEYKELDCSLQNKLRELSSEKIEENIYENNDTNTSEEKVENSPEKKDKNSSELRDEKSPTKQDGDKSDQENNVKTKHKSPRKSFKNANDTKELLDMISDFTDKTRCEIEEEDVPAPQPKVTESKIEPMRLSFAQKRQSVVFSREDLLNNISMAQAALQKSRIEIDESAVDETQETFTEEATSPQKTGRLSSEVVKTLHFDDESISASSTKSEAKDRDSPLRKTAFGETSYMKDNKANVIPSYLQDVTSGIKALMSDLIKPMADVLPFNSTPDQQLRKSISTHDTQIQANLVTSSQIDIETESSCNLQSENASSFCFRNHMLKALPDSDKLISSDTDVVASEPSDSWYFQPHCVTDPPTAGQVLIFDHSNPLNNILLGPLDCSNAHPYYPVTALNDYPQKSDETLCGSEHSAACQVSEDFALKDCDMEPDKVTTMYHFNVIRSPQKDSAQERPEEIADAGVKSKILPIKLPAAVVHIKQEQHTIETKNTEVNNSKIKTSPLKNAEVNTVIAMKENKELLNASSSLTLVDDSIVETSEDCTSKTSCDERKIENLPSPKRAVYEIKVQDDITELETDTDANDIDKKVKSKKRNYKPTSLMTAVLPNVDITPKPKSKMQKLSTSPESKYTTNITQPSPKVTPERDVETHERILTYEKVDLKPRRNKEKTGTTLTVQSVQQVITEFHVEAGMNQSILGKQARQSGYSTTNPTSQSDMEYSSFEDASSFTSSKHLHAIKREESVSTDMSGLKSQSAVPSEHSSKSGWHHDMKSMSSSASDFDAGVNIVAKIDMLPFMGSHECEWESSTADTWCFRLLHGRIRLTVRLAHSHANAIKTRVRADTPVNDITVETIQHEKKNPVSFLCVRFACESMRYMVAHALGEDDAELGAERARAPAPVRARAVPALLRRCAATARVALRWGRAMHDAKLQLAYTLTHDGFLTLKVANIPLRSVWEVSLRLALVAERGGAPWPRAGDVRVTRVVSDVRVRDSDVRRALHATPHDWGHAPRTVWRIFRYLKNKTRDDDLLLGA